MLKAMIIRNIKLFFKDKGMFFTSLITPLILLVLYGTFLGNVYTDTFEDAIPEGFNVSSGLISATVSGELISSLLAVSCITVAFCSNMLIVQDKVNGTRRDLTVAPVKSSVLSISYYIATEVSTLIVNFAALAACLVYSFAKDCYMTASDIAYLCGDIVLLTLFGTALSSIINVFLSSQGQISAVGTIVSAGYGFLCGAYMPISNFSEGLQKFLSYLPGTYGTSMLRNHAMRGAFEEMANQNIPEELIDGIKKSVDCTLYFSGNEVTLSSMFAYMAITVAVLIGAYIALNIILERKSR